MKRRVRPVEHLERETARQSGQQVNRIMREAVPANRSAHSVENSRGLEEADRTTHVLHIDNQLAKPGARIQLVEFARAGRLLSSGDRIERMIANQMQFVVRRGIL